MKTASTLALCIAISIVANAQEVPTEANTQRTKVIGGLDDGKPSPPATSKVLPLFKINWSTVHQKKEHKVIINKVNAPTPVFKQPVPSWSVEDISRRNEELKKRIGETRESGGFFIVSATIYDRKTTYVRWWHEGKEYAAFSNVDWNHLGGFHEFVGREKRYSMILFSVNLSINQTRTELRAGYRTSLPDLPKLPQLSERGATYMVVKGDDKNDAAMEFIEAIHDLYDEHRAELVNASLEREKNRLIHRKKQEELKQNPPQKPDIIINYWKKKTPIEGRENK